MSGLAGPIHQVLAAEGRRREEIQRPSYLYPEDYSPPETFVPNSAIPTPRKELNSLGYNHSPAPKTISLDSPVDSETSQHWADYSNRGIIFNPNIHYSKNPEWPQGNLHSKLPEREQHFLDTFYSKNKQKFKEFASNPFPYLRNLGMRNKFYYDSILPLGPEFEDGARKLFTRQQYIGILAENGPTYLANKKLEKLGSSERLPYGAALHPDTFHDIMGISAKKYKQAQAQAQQTPTPASTSQAREVSGSAVMTTTPASISTARQQDNVVPGFNEITSFDPSRVTRSNSAPSTGNTSTTEGSNRPGSLATGGSILGAPGSSGFSFGQTSNSRTTPSSSTSGTNTTRRLEQNLQSRIYSLNAPGYLNFENPYPIHGDMPYPARSLDAKRNPTVAQGNLATQLNALYRRDPNSVAYDDARTNVQIESNIHTALDNQKKQIEEISQALQRTLGPIRLQNLDPTELAKSINAPRSYHYIVQRDSGYVDPNSNDPRVVRGHQVILEHRKISKRGTMKTKGFEIVQAPDHGQALLAIEPKKHLLAQYIENENYKARDKQITAIKRNMSNFIRTYNRQSVGTPSDVHAANQANRAAVVRTANILARRVSSDDYTDILGKILRTQRGQY